MTNYQNVEEFRKRFEQTYQNISHDEIIKEIKKDPLQPKVVKPTDEKDYLRNMKNQSNAFSNIVKRLYQNKD
jgi:predicted CopG family antitoxin